MKYLVISDIHGSFKYLSEALKKKDKYSCNKIIILGDILYHGPRNDLPLEYNPKKCIPLLNELKDCIIAIKGNCDAEVDQMVLDFPLLDSSTIEIDSKKIWLSHGHHLKNLPAGIKYAMHGHTHLSGGYEKGGVLFLNPGSISIPKGDLINSYAILEGNTFKVYDFNDELIKEAILD